MEAIHQCKKMEQYLCEEVYIIYGYEVPLEVLVHKVYLRWFLKCSTNTNMFELYLN